MLLVLCDWHSQKEEKEVGQESGCARSPRESCGLFRATTFICYRYQCDTKVAAFIKAEKQLESLRAGLRAADLFEIWPCASCFTGLLRLVQWFHCLTRDSVVIRVYLMVVCN